MVQRDRWDTSWGGEKIFAIRNLDGPAMTAGRVGGILLIRGPEVSRRSLRVVLDMGNRLRRVRGRFHR